jgi:hypothetical protein
MKKIDVYIITYTETNGESNYRFIEKNLYPQVKRIDNIKGRSNAYAKIFEDTDADYVYIVSGDHNVNTDFKFIVPSDDAVHVWPSKNRANQMISYSSGIKLFPVAPFKDHKFNKIDPLLDITHKIVLEKEPGSVDQWDYSDFAMFTHIVKQNLTLRMMIDEQIVGAKEEFEKWQEWEAYPEFSRENIKVFWEFASTLDPYQISESLFDTYDDLKKMFIDSFIKTEINAR